MTDKTFRGTLLLLQNKTKRDPDAYRDEFMTQLRHFDAVAKTITFANIDTATSAGPVAETAVSGDVSAAQNPQFLAVLHYVTQVSSCFAKECVPMLPQFLLNALKHGKTKLSPETRLAFVQNLILLRNKGLVEAHETLPVLFSLLEVRDKNLRRIVLAHVVGDIRRVNQPGHKNGSHVNKQIQNFMFGVMDEDDSVHARSAMIVMIDLYRRNVWCNDRTVEVLSRACFSKHSRIVRLALRFFLQQMPRLTSVQTDSGSDSEDPGKKISKLKQKLKIKKKTKKRDKTLARSLAPLKDKFDNAKREDRFMTKIEVDPIRLLREPQTFAERLLAKLSKTTERFEVRILFLSVIARVVSEYNVVLLGLYPFLERYMEPTQIHATQLLALASTSVHEDVPPDALEPLVRSIANHFVNDRSDSDRITIGINTIREICKRQPLCMDTALLTDLVEYKQRRGERGVIMAARALLQLYRDVYPEMLPTKLRGMTKIKDKDADGNLITNNAPTFGTKRPLQDIPGMELLFADRPESDGDTAEEPGSSDEDAPSDELFEDDEEIDEEIDEEAEEADNEDEEELDEDDEELELEEGEEEEDMEDDEDLDALGSDVVEEDDEADEADDEEDDDAPELVPYGRPSANGFNVDDDVWGEDDDEENVVADEPPMKKSRQEGKAAKGQAKAKATVPAPRLQAESDAESDRRGWKSCDSDSSGVIDFGSDEGDSEEDGEWQMVGDDAEAEDLFSESDEDAAAQDETGMPAPGSEWFEDAGKKKAASVGGTSGAASHRTAGTTCTSASYNRVLSDEDFEKLRRARIHAVGGDKRGKALAAEKRLQRRQEMLHSVRKGALVDPNSLETFTTAKRERDKQKLIDEARDKRANNNPFEMRKKRKNVQVATNIEKSKTGKLYQMTKRSARVALKLKRSVEDRRDHKKDMDKKNIKFRIARGWKA